MADEQRIRGVLLDVDGVLHIDGEPIPGAGDALDRLRAIGVPFRLLTNGTMRSRTDLSGYLGTMGISVNSDEILTAVTAAAEFVRIHHAGEPCYLLASPGLEDEFDGVPLTIDEADARVVVVGGASDAFTFEAVNRAYRMLRGGAALVAMHKSRHWLTRDGITLDSGPYIHGLEWASGRPAAIAGKPERHFFEAGFASLGLLAAEVAMVGDEPFQDVQAAMECGATGILVQTGLGSIETPSGVSPDIVLTSVADLAEAIAGFAAP